MTQATDLADATASRDPEVGLAAVASLRALLESLEALQVDNARDRGWSWQQIAGGARGQQAGGPQEARRRAAAARAEGAVMFERFSKSAREVVVRAQADAGRSGASGSTPTCCCWASRAARARRRACCRARREHRALRERAASRGLDGEGARGDRHRPRRDPPPRRGELRAGRARARAGARVAATCRSRRAPRRRSSCRCARRSRPARSEIGPEHVLLGVLREGGAETPAARGRSRARRAARRAQPGGESSRTRSVISSSARAASGCSPAR